MANAFMTLGGHARAGNVRWGSAAAFALVGILGGLVGSVLGKAFDGERLLFLFAVLMVVVGGLMLRPARGGPVDEPATMSTPKVVASALAVGMLSRCFGIGGGFLIVPGLLFATGMPMINAVGSSLLAVGAFGLATAGAYALLGMVDWTVAAQFIAGRLFGGLIGMRLACRLAEYKCILNRIFAGGIFVEAGYKLHRNAGASTL